MAGALLYLPDRASSSGAARLVAGRSLTVRALAAAYHAGAAPIGVPSVLREESVAHALARLPRVAGAVRWLDSGVGAEGASFAGAPCVLVPAGALVDARAILTLLEPSPGPVGAALAGSAADGAPLVLVPGTVVARIWDRLVAGEPLGDELLRHIQEARPERRHGRAVFARSADAAGLACAEDALYRALGTEWDSAVDRLLHRRCSRWLTRLLLLTPVTPNQVSLGSLAIGCAAIWCFWRATAASAVAGVALYALATIVDHSDGEIARLSFRESPFGAYLDWAVDTIIHGGLVLAMGVTAGGPILAVAGVLGSAGVILSAWFARLRPRQAGGRPWPGGAIDAMGNRDLFYLLIVVFALSRWLLPLLLGPLALLVAVGSQAYWIGCAARVRATSEAATD